MGKRHNKYSIVSISNANVLQKAEINWQQFSMNLLLICLQLQVSILSLEEKTTSPNNNQNDQSDSIHKTVKKNRDEPHKSKQIWKS